MYGLTLEMISEGRVGHGLAVGEGDREAAVGVVVGAQPRVERGHHEERVGGVALERGAALDRLHHRGVEPDPAVEQEVAVADPAEPDAAERLAVQGVEELARPPRPGRPGCPRLRA